MHKKKLKNPKDKIVYRPYLNLSKETEDFVVHCYVSNQRVRLCNGAKKQSHSIHILSTKEVWSQSCDAWLGIKSSSSAPKKKNLSHYIYNTKGIVVVNHKSPQHILDWKLWDKEDG